MEAPAEKFYQSGRMETPSLRRGVHGLRVIEAAKENVEVIQLADWLCGPGKMRRIGNLWVAPCPIPGHDERTASFTVYPETNSWYCFGACQRGGDVVNLAAAAWGYSPNEQKMAAALLLHEFGHDIPKLPESFFAKNARQAPVREAIRRQRVEVLRRRLFRIFILPEVKAWTGKDDRRAEVESAWQDFRTVPVESLLDRVDGEL